MYSCVALVSCRGQHAVMAPYVSAALAHKAGGTSTKISRRSIAAMRCAAIITSDEEHEPTSFQRATAKASKQLTQHTRPGKPDSRPPNAIPKPEQGKVLHKNKRLEKNSSIRDNKGPNRHVSKLYNPQGHQQKKINAKLLTSHLKQTTKPEEMLRLVQEHRKSLDNIHIAAAITQLGQWCREQPKTSKSDAVQQLMTDLEQLLLSSGRLQQCGPRPLSNIIWSCSLLRYTSTPLYNMCLQAFVGVLHRVDSLQHLSNVLYGFALSGQQISQEQCDDMIAVAAKEDLLHTAAPQSVSNIIWSAAKLGHQLSEQQLQQLLAFITSKLSVAKPQDVSNTLWAVATMQQSISKKQLQHMVACLISKAAVAKPQHVSNTIWAAATMQQSVTQRQVQQLVAGLLDQLEDVNPQDISNALWGLAKMKSIVTLQQLQTLEVALLRQVNRTTAQDVTSSLWAFGELRYYPQQLLAALQRQQLWPTLLPSMEPRALGQLAVALGTLDHRDDHLMAALLQQAVNRSQQQQVAGGLGRACTTPNSSSSSSSVSALIQPISNLCWSVAVLDMQQHISEILVLLQFCGKHFDHCEPEALQQLHQGHLWLMGIQHSDATGLCSVLDVEQLKRCEAVWCDQVQQHAAQDHSDFQKEVYRFLQQLPLTWHAPPAMEQLCEPDGMFSIDISGATAEGVRLAIEADGPTHFRRPDNKPTGPTLYRNRALAARGYVVISVPVHEWEQLRGSGSKQQYLMRRVQQQLALHKEQTQHDKQPSPSQITVAPVVDDRGMRRRATHRTQVQQQQQQLKQQQTEQQTQPVLVTATGRVRRIRRRQQSSS